MNIRIFSLSIAVLLGGSVMASVHQRKVVKQKPQLVDSVVIIDKYIDTLMKVRQSLDSTVVGRTHSDDARYYRLFAPLTFYHSIADKQFAITPRTKGRDDVEDAVDKALMNIYLSRPDLVTNYESQLQEKGSFREDVERPVKQNFTAVKDVTPIVIDEPEVIPTGGMVVKKPNFWTFTGDSYLQFLQNYVSSNWYKGGESDYSMVGSVTLTANYNNQKRLKFENTLELKLGFQTSRGDTVNRFKTNNDLIRYTGKLGLQASKRWYYTLQLLAYTQFTKGMKSNDEYVYSDFMSPFNLNVGLGMDYSYESKDKKVKLSVNLSPLSFNFRYVGRKELASSYAIRGDHHTLEDFGSQLTTNCTITFSPQVKWTSRLYGYTTYRRAEIEWENTVSLAVSKYLSTNIFVYPRFDDSTDRDSDMGYWQFKEYCALGFTYAF